MPSMNPRALPRAISARGRLGAGVAAAAAAAGLLATAAPASAASPYPGYLLEQGSRGPAVTEVQEALHVGDTGYFGPVTRSFVVAFQRRDGLQVDGIVGPHTWAALFPSTESSYTPTYHSTYTAPTYHRTYTAPTSSYTTHTYTTHSTYSTTRTYSAPSRATYSSGGYSIPSSIVQCESGGNYSAVNPSSGAGGAYQILPSTWAAYGGQGLPQNASPAEQGAIAAKIYASQGPSAWVCK